MAVAKCSHSQQSRSSFLPWRDVWSRSTLQVSSGIRHHTSLIMDWASNISVRQHLMICCINIVKNPFPRVRNDGNFSTQHLPLHQDANTVGHVHIHQSCYEENSNSLQMLRRMIHLKPALYFSSAKTHNYYCNLC